VNQLHGRGGSGLAVRNVDDLEVADIEPMLACRGIDFVNRTDQNRLDDSGFGLFRGPAQRRLIARINNEGRRSRDGARPRNQAIILAVRRVGRRSRRCDWPEFKARVPAAYHARSKAVVREFASAPWRATAEGKTQWATH